MKNIWKWSIASACIFAALILIAWLAAALWRSTTSYLPTASPDEVNRTQEQAEQKPTARVEATIASERPPQPAAHDTVAVADALPSTSPTAVPSTRRMEDLAKAIEALPKGNIVLRAPDAMRVAERRTVEASVGANVPMEILRKQVDSRDKAVEGTLRVSSEMAATLNGAGFKIEPVTPEQQAIAEGFPTVWSWNVEAQQEGEQELEATLYALVPDGASSSRLRVESYVQKITVSVREQTWGEWLESLAHEVDAAKAILSTLVAAATVVFGWFGFSLTRKKGKVAAKSGRRKSPA